MAKTRFSQLFEERLLVAISNRAQDLALGVPTEQYREEVGYCRGLREALKLCEEVEREFD